MDTTVSFHLSGSDVPSASGILHLRRYWEKARARKAGLLALDALAGEWNRDNALLAALGLGLEPTVIYLFHSNGSFEEFEAWIRQTTGGPPDPARVEAFNRQLLQGNDDAQAPSIEKVLTEAETDQWEKEGYVILRQAISREDCEATIALICAHIGIDRYDPSTWYEEHADRKGIMVQLFQHPLLEKNRNTPRIRKAFEQLWGRKDIHVNTDRVGFNPPETPFWHFPGPRLHWDVSLKCPIPFGTQGILYLADTAADQGAFTLVPGFQHKVEQWMAALPPGTSPRNQDLQALGPLPVAANAGDLIIWHQALPHSSSPNTSSLPRFVQYINYEPHNKEIQEEWI